MIIYRPHRGGLKEAMSEAKEFNNVEDMKEYIVKQHTDDVMGEAFSKNDIVLEEDGIEDKRTGWKDTRHICVKRYYNENFPIPQCIGWFATKYKKRSRVNPRLPFSYRVVLLQPQPSGICISRGR